MISTPSSTCGRVIPVDAPKRQYSRNINARNSGKKWQAGTGIDSVPMCGGLWYILDLSREVQCVPTHLLRFRAQENQMRKCAGKKYLVMDVSISVGVRGCATKRGLALRVPIVSTSRCPPDIFLPIARGKRNIFCVVARLALTHASFACVL